MMLGIMNKISFKENKRRFLNLKGIFSRCVAYKGPDVIQIDLTDKCNSNCLLCWLNSPLRLKQDNCQELDLKVTKNFIGDVASSGVQEIIFSGGGEPFLYSGIWEVLEFTQRMGLKFRINTNITSLDKKDIVRLLSFSRLASVSVSIWSGKSDIYAKLHGRDRDLFHKAVSNIKLLNSFKPSNLHVRMNAIISNINFSDTAGLINFAEETGCDTLEFGVPDVIPGTTDSFLLDKKQLNLLKLDVAKLVRKQRNRKSVKLANMSVFLRRISNPKAVFGEYDTYLDKLPCYAGWVFLRVRANGDFNSCLKSHNLPLGNVYRDSFVSIWNNSAQQEFRKKSLSIHKDRKYFSLMGNGNNGQIGCRRVCDNLIMNSSIHKIAKYLLWLKSEN